MALEEKPPQRIKWDRGSLWSRCLQFLQWSQDSGKSSATIKKYGQVLREFAQWCDGKVISPELITGYNVHLIKDLKLMPWTSNQRMIIVGAFFKWMLRKGHIDSNPLEKCDVIHRKVEFHKEVFTPEEYEKLKAAAVGTKHAYLLACLYNTGMRIGDAIRLKWENVNLVEQVIVIKPLKTIRHHQTAIVPIISGNDFTVMLNSLWSQRQALPPEIRSAYVGPHITDEREMASQVGNAIVQFNHWIKDQGHTKRAHSLRRTFITNMLSSGVDSMMAMQIVGISSVATMKHYVAPNTKALRAAVAQGFSFATKAA